MSRVASLQLSLTDISRVAGVQRPAVSMWRKRELAGHPFPAPVAQVGGEERFDAAEVAAYLEATGRGTNPSVTADMAAHTRLTSVTDLPEPIAVDGLTALLCLSAATGESLSELERSPILALARQIDPDDTLLLHELEALGSDLVSLAGYADALADASYSVSAAFELLLHQQRHRSLPGHAATHLQPTAERLVAAVAHALASQAGMSTPVFVDISDSSGDLLLATTTSYAADSAPSLATVALDTRTARLTRRRLRAHDLHRIDATVREDGFDVADPRDEVVHLLHLPPAGQPDLSDVEILRVVDELVLRMDDSQRAVVIGPASALTDRPATSEVDLARDAILRTDRLRAAVRLPVGLLSRSPRQALALWALGPAHPDVPRAQRWTVVADLTDTPLTGTVLEGVVDDVVAAMTPDDRSAQPGVPAELVLDDAGQVRGHRFRHARRVRTASILPGRTALVDSSARAAPRPSTQPDLILTINDLVSQLPPGLLSGLRVDPTLVEVSGTTSRPHRTLGDAVTAGALRLVPGNRIDPADIHSGAAGRFVIGPEELSRQSRIGSRRIDLLTFAGSYPSARFTEPDDIIFCTTSHTVAWVDDEGGHVVESPARLLRVNARTGPGLLPTLLAADITTALAHTGPHDWRCWPARHIPGDQRKQLAATLTEIERERNELRDRLALLDALSVALSDGVTDGSLTIRLQTNSTETAPTTATPTTVTPQLSAPASRGTPSPATMSHPAPPREDRR